MSISDDRCPAEWDKLPVPRTATQLLTALGDYEDGANMFFPITGLPRAYMGIPTGFPRGGDYRMPQVMRVVYHVLAYKKQLRDGEEGEAVEPELVECMWRDMLYIRKVMDDTFGDIPVLFWRREPEFTVEQEEGSNARYARLYMRLEVPGFDWRRYPVHSHIGDNSSERPWPSPVSEAKKEEIRLANEVLRLSEESTRASQDHLNALHRLIDLRSRNQFSTAGMQYKCTESPLPTFYGPGVAGMMQEQTAKGTSAMRQLLDSQLMQPRVGDGVALVPCANPNMPPREDLERVKKQIDELGG